LSDVDPREVIAAKRDGRRLEPDELRGFVISYARGDVPDYQAAALVMAAYIHGLDEAETLALTRAMVESGETLPLEGISRSKVDKMG
jgi:pyrimidine-nucleoside phosphorylase